MSRVDYVYEQVDLGWRVECEVTGTVVPHVPARLNCRNDEAMSSEGGYLEDVSFKVTGFSLDVCGVSVVVELTEAAREALESKLREWYDEDSEMRGGVWDEFGG